MSLREVGASIGIFEFHLPSERCFGESYAMRDQWYADNRALVKWGVLLALAERLAARQVLQVLYYRPTQWAQLEIDGQRVSLSDAVLEHFRQVTSISHIHSPVPVEVVADILTDRVEYQRVIIARIRARGEAPGIVFLDPDTGLECSSPGLQHVLNCELTELWSNLRDGDVLVLYQHQTNRAGLPWIEQKKAQFERALGVPQGTAKVARAAGIARDMALFYIQKAGFLA